MDLCLVNSPLFRDFNALYDEDSLPPLGLGYIATQVKLRGLQVEIVDAVADRLPLEHLIDYVVRTRPNAVGINLFTTNFELVKELIEAVSGHTKRVIVGGLATRTLHEAVFEWNVHCALDIVFGDGELLVPDLLQNIERQAPSKTSKNRRFFVVDKQSPYFCSDISGLPLDRALLKAEPIHHPRGFVEANIVASRGCIYNCAFCAAARSLNGDLAIRERSTECLLGELRDIAQEYPEVKSIRVLDDLFLKGPASIDSAIEVFSKASFAWRSMAHVLTFTGIDDEKMTQLRKSGCTELFVGVESGSPRILKSIHKTNDIDKIVSNLSSVLRARIGLKAYFIYGFPTETVADFELTYALATKLRDVAAQYSSPYRTSVFQFRPYHGTELFHTLVKAGTPPDAVMRIEGNPNLSSLVGRLQFNFHSGNYSSASLEDVQRFIHMTANLSTAEAWGFR